MSLTVADWNHFLFGSVLATYLREKSSGTILKVKIVHLSKPDLELAILFNFILGIQKLFQIIDGKNGKISFIFNHFVDGVSKPLLNMPYCWAHRGGFPFTRT